MAERAVGDTPYQIRSGSAAGTLEFVWETKAGKIYDLLESTNLVDWTRANGYPRVAEGASLTHVFLDGPRRFFRRVSVSDMALVPGGNFQMGDNFSEGGTEERPVHNVQVDSFFMDKYEVCGELYEQVRAWGNANGYDLSGGGNYGTRHPQYDISWYDAVKWCNARSEREGLTPVYCTDTAKTTVYRSGSVGLDNDMVRWTANGYRLPTEAEWEKAARGGRTGNRYPWGDTISTANANYAGDPWSSSAPVGTFPANDYGLFDMAGNVWEWTWDWYLSTYYGSTDSLTNPRGPISGSGRVLRGGSWYDDSSFQRVARREGKEAPSRYWITIGFRCVRGL